MSAPPPIGFSAPPYPSESNSNFAAVPPPYTPHATPGQAVPPSNRPAPAGYQPYSGPTAPVPGVYVPQQYGGTTVVTVQPARQQTNQIIIVGACPSCRVGVLQDSFTCLGICCCVFLFPLGIICCLAMKKRRCSNCGAQFG